MSCGAILGVVLPDLRDWGLHSYLCGVVDLQKLPAVYPYLGLRCFIVKELLEYLRYYRPCLKASVPKASLRVLSESEWYISASVKAMIVERLIRDGEVSEKFLNSSCDDHPEATRDCTYSGRIYTAPRYAS